MVSRRQRRSSTFSRKKRCARRIIQSRKRANGTRRSRAFGGMYNSLFGRTEKDKELTHSTHVIQGWFNKYGHGDVSSRFSQKHYFKLDGDQLTWSDTAETIENHNTYKSIRLSECKRCESTDDKKIELVFDDKHYTFLPCRGHNDTFKALREKINTLIPETYVPVSEQQDKLDTYIQTVYKLCHYLNPNLFELLTGQLERGVTMGPRCWNENKTHEPPKLTPFKGSRKYALFTHGYKLRCLIRDALKSIQHKVTVRILSVGTPKSTLSSTDGSSSTEKLFHVKTPGQFVCNTLHNTLIVHLNANDRLDLSKADKTKNIDDLLYVLIGNGASVELTIDDILQCVLFRHAPSEANVLQESGFSKKWHATQGSKMNQRTQLSLDAICTNDDILFPFIRYIRGVLESNQDLLDFLQGCFDKEQVRYSPLQRTRETALLFYLIAQDIGIEEEEEEDGATSVRGGSGVCTITIKKGNLGMVVEETNDPQYKLKFTAFTGNNDLQAQAKGRLPVGAFLTAIDGKDSKGWSYTDIENHIKEQCPCTLTFSVPVPQYLTIPMSKNIMDILIETDKGHLSDGTNKAQESYAIFREYLTRRSDTLIKVTKNFLKHTKVGKLLSLDGVSPPQMQPSVDRQRVPPSSI